MWQNVNQGFIYSRCHAIAHGPACELFSFNFQTKNDFYIWKNKRKSMQQKKKKCIWPTRPKMFNILISMLPVQGAWVWSLVRELDPTCVLQLGSVHAATKRSHMLQLRHGAAPPKNVYIYVYKEKKPRFWLGPLEEPLPGSLEESGATAQSRCFLLIVLMSGKHVPYRWA